MDSEPAYTGKITDSDTNLQNNLYRWHDAVLGQWASQDPIVFEANDPNIRRYASNSPVNLLDKDGLDGTVFTIGDGTGITVGPAGEIPPDAPPATPPWNLPTIAPFPVPGNIFPPSTTAPVINTGVVSLPGGMGTIQAVAGQLPSTQGSGPLLGGQVIGPLGTTSAIWNPEQVQIQHTSNYLDLYAYHEFSTNSGNVLATNANMQLYAAWQQGQITQLQLILISQQLQMQAWLAAQQGSISGGVMGPNYQLGYQQTPQGAQGSISWQQYLSNYGPNAQLNIGGLYGNGPQGQTVGGSIGVSGIPSNWPINGSIWSAAANVTITPGPNSSQTIGGNIGVTW